MASTRGQLGRSPAIPESHSLFEHSPWFYAFCREYLFRDHTEKIASELVPEQPRPGFRLLELGCGPGFYACRLARLFPNLEVTGVDLSNRLVERARNRAASRNLPNCSFERGDAQALAEQHQEVDAIVLSRLFLIVPDKVAVLSEIFRILRPGGRCFIAEPTSSPKTMIPLSCMWMLSRLGNRPLNGCREPLRRRSCAGMTFAS